MSRPRVLYIDDEPELLDITKIFLEQSNEIEVDIEQDQYMAIERIARGSYDVIVADYQMPGMDGIAFLKEIRKMGSLPFILFTGKGREEVAIQALNSGADFYLQKGGDPQVQFSELRNAIIQLAQRKIMENRLVQGERKYRDLVESANNIILKLDSKGCITFINRFGQEFFGLGEDVIGRSVADVVTGLKNYTEETIAEVRELLEGLTSDHCPLTNSTCPMPRNDGTEALLSWTVKAIRDADNELMEVLIIGSDITESYRTKQLLEELELKHSHVLNGIGEGIFAIDQKDKVIFANQRLSDMIGRSLEKVIGSQILDLFPEEERDIPRQNLERRKEGALGRFDYRMRREDDGKEFWVKVSSNPIIQNGQYEGMLYAVTDITAYKRVEASLRTSEERFSQIAENANEWIWEMNLEGLYTYSSPAAERILGYSPEELVGKVHFYDLLMLDVRQDLQVKVINAFAGKEPLRHLLSRNVHKNGQVVVLDTTCFPVFGEGDTLLGYRGVNVDFTEREAAEDALRRDEACNRALFELSQTPGLTPKGLAEKAMVHCLELTGSRIGFIGYLSEDEKALTMQHYSAMAKEPQELKNRTATIDVNATGLLGEAMRQRRPVIINDYNAPDIVKKGLPEWHIRLKRVMIVPVFDRGRIAVLAGVGNKETDYTEKDALDLSLLMSDMWRIARKMEAEEALRESEKRFRNFMEMSSEELYLLDEDGHIIECNSVACDALGLSREKLLSMNAMDFMLELREEHQGESVLHQITEQDLSEALRTGQSRWFDRSINMDHHLPDGSVRYGQMVAFPIKTEKGWRIGISIRDVTIQRMDARRKKATELQQTMAMDMTHVVHWEYDVSSETFTFNDRFYALYGTTADREGGYQMPMRRYLREFVHPDDLERTINNNAVAATSPEGSNQIEHRIVRRDGEVRSIMVRSKRTVYDSNGTLRVFGVNQDITEMERAKEALREANEKLNLLSSITRHDVGNQLIIQRGYLDLAKNKVTDPAPLEYLQKIEDSVKLVQRQLEFTKDYEMMGVASPQWQAVEKTWQDMPGLSMVDNLDIEKNVRILRVYADPMLGKVFHNLFEDSIKYGGRPTFIKMRCQKVDEDLMLVYEDKGPGIPAEDKERIFQKGFGKGTGLGLFLSRQILSITGISLQETGEPGEGARFEMRIPAGQYRFE